MIQGKEIFIITHKSEIIALEESPVKVVRIILQLKTIPTIRLAYSVGGLLKTQKVLKMDLKNGIKKLLNVPGLTNVEKTNICKLLKIPVPHHLSEKQKGWHKEHHNYNKAEKWERTPAKRKTPARNVVKAKAKKRKTF
jgi:Na+-transporting NADH:ubiquinone oxidoreductase subunit NqrC